MNTSITKERNKFAIGFADWLAKLSPAQRVSLWSKSGEHSGLFTMDNEQLLEKYTRKLKRDKDKATDTKKTKSTRY